MAGKKEAAGKPQCLVPDCTNPPEVRGMCRSCYQAARKRVADGQITWEQLEAEGLAQPAYERAAGPFERAFRERLQKAS